MPVRCFRLGLWAAAKFYRVAVIEMSEDMKDYSKLKKLLFKLAGALGVAGDENLAAKIAKEELEKYMPVHIDALGNVVGKLEGEGPHILLDAHIDQIGMIVTAIDDKGFIKFDKCGGSDIRVLAAHEVTVWGQKPLVGAICSTPPHLAKVDDAGKAKAFADLAIDVGLPKSEVEKYVSLGDRISLNARQATLLGNRVSSPAIDDRAGVASILRCLEILKEREHKASLTVLFSVQEETGGSGAKVGGYTAKADEAIAVDVSFACAPGVPKEKCAALGGGTMIGIAPVLDRALTNKLTQLAKEKEIPYRLEVMSGRTGTNADSIQNVGEGVKMALLSIPLRNMHTGVEVVDLEDLESTAQLMAEYIVQRGAANA